MNCSPVRFPPPNLLRLGADVETSVADGRCKVRISINAVSDTESWYHLWEAVAALDAMCIRVGKKGTAGRLGRYTISFCVLIGFFFFFLDPLGKDGWKGWMDG